MYVFLLVALVKFIEYLPKISKILYNETKILLVHELSKLYIVFGFKLIAGKTANVTI
jgi:hypothetical protein